MPGPLPFPGPGRTQIGMTTIPARQPQGVPSGGQFAAMTKPEATGVTLGAAAAGAAQQSRARYKELQNRRWDLETEATVHAAAAVASQTREMFPESRYITFIDTSYSLTPNAVLDSNLNALAYKYGTKAESAAYEEWAEAGAAVEEDHDVSVDGLSAGLMEHGGKLDGILVEAPRGARHDVVLGIDEVLARAAQSEENLANGIVTPAAAWEEPEDS